LARYIDSRLGREGTLALLAATTNAQVLAALQTTEAQLLLDWDAWVRAGG